jgi:hypothetical protein
MDLPTIEIAATDATPRVYLNPQAGVFEITGRSYPSPQSLELFYNPIINWLKEYAKQPNRTTDFTFDFEHFNTATTKMLLQILEIVGKLPNYHVVWYSDEAEWRTHREFEDICEIQMEWKPRKEEK